MKTRAIVVDDDMAIVDLLSDFLELNDFEVVGKGYDGRDGINLFEQHKPDVVFLDLVMPNYDGKYSLRQIRKQDPTANVIIVTGESSARHDPTLIALKPSAIVTKPFDIQDILEKTKKLLAQ